MRGKLGVTLYDAESSGNEGGVSGARGPTRGRIVMARNIAGPLRRS